MEENYDEEQCRAEHRVDDIPVKLILHKRIRGPDVEKPWWTLSWRTNYSASPSSTNRQRYWYKEACWRVPPDIALKMINAMESLGGLDEKYSDHRGVSPPEFLVSAEMAIADRANALEEVTESDGDDWGMNPFFVICFDPNDEWKKVLLINTETDIATFRSITRRGESQKKSEGELQPDADWRVDNSMMDANVQQMRVFHSQLKRYLSRK